MALPQRKSPRLAGYNYGQQGAYFVTICVQDRLCLLGTISDGMMHPSPAGVMVADWWGRLPQAFTDVHLDAMVVMPNHLHGIVLLDQDAATKLPDVIWWFKSMTTNAYIRGVQESHWARFNKRFWQRSYYDHIVRNESDMARIQAYIETNPARWEADSLRNG